VVAVLAAVPADVASAADPLRTWYVKAGAGDGGRGTSKRPFGTLARVESVSRPGDRIVIQRARRKAGALDGGIRLKRRQRLIGAGAAVTAAARDRAPRLTNTDPSRVDGDAVRLARRAVVRNLVIAGAVRGGIYGRGATGAKISGNDVSGHNRSCTPGFHIPPFNVPTTVPGVVVPISDGLRNGWAGIMVDASRRRGALTIRRNRVHDADCGDGIDVRVSGSARLRARISRNVASDLRQGPDFESILAFGLQTREKGRLVATLDRNRQSGLGNDEDVAAGPEGADSEGVFINPTGPSNMTVTVTRNTYEHTRGRGGFSANGLEFVSMGDGTRALVEVRDSTFSGTPGDVLEQLALGTNAHLRLRLDRVEATRSTGHAESGTGDTVLIPGNNGDCLLSASGGAGNTVELRVRHSALSDCANNGLTFGSAVANGSGPTSALIADVADSRITGNRGGNLRIGNLSELDLLRVKVERTNLSASQGATSTPANLTVEELGTTKSATIDLGGGALGSSGGNCLHDGNLAAAVVGYDVHARQNWWGQPEGPAPGRTTTVGGSLDTGTPLAAPAPGC